MRYSGYSFLKQGRIKALTVTDQKIIPLDEDERFYIPLRKLYPNDKIPSHPKKARLSKGQTASIDVSLDTKSFIKQLRDELDLSSYGHVIEYLKMQMKMKLELLKYAEELQQTLQQYSGLMMKVSKLQAEMVEDKIENKYKMVQDVANDSANSVEFWDALQSSLKSVPPQTKARFLQQLGEMSWNDDQYTLKVMPILENLFNHTINQTKAIIRYAFNYGKNK